MTLVSKAQHSERGHTSPVMTGFKTLEQLNSSVNLGGESTNSQKNFLKPCKPDYKDDCDDNKVCDTGT